MFHISLQVTDERSKTLLSSGELQLLTIWRKSQNIFEIQVFPCLKITPDTFTGEPLSILCVLHAGGSIRILD